MDKMDKLDKFYTKLETEKRGVYANNGDYGYFVTIAELLKNGGEDEFFRKTRGGKVSRNVYCGLCYDRSEKAYFAECWNDCSSHSGALKKNDIVFFGFTY